MMNFNGAVHIKLIHGVIPLTLAAFMFIKFVISPTVVIFLTEFESLKLFMMIENTLKNLFQKINSLRTFKH
jgi:hypothetical protein